MSWANNKKLSNRQIAKSPKYAKSPLAENSIQATAPSRKKRGGHQLFRPRFDHDLRQRLGLGHPTGFVVNCATSCRLLAVNLASYSIFRDLENGTEPAHARNTGAT